MVQDLVGSTLEDRYRFGELLGEGTFARVYKVYDLKRGVELAAKVLRQDIAHEHTLVERFRREAEVLRQLQHPHIVRYYDTVETSGFVFILMEYVAGETLQTYLYRNQTPLTVTQSLGMMRPVCTALTYAHGEGVIHRDVKPGNILINQNQQVYLTDFGIARLLDVASTLTQDNAVGTPLYMAPEQILGQPITLAADIYAVGVVLYQMVTGQRPFVGDHPEAVGTTAGERVAYEHVNLPPVSPREHNPALPEAAERVILRCLRKEPTSRYPSAIAVYDALAESVGATPAQMSAVSIEHSQKPQPPQKTLPEWSKISDRESTAATLVKTDLQADPQRRQTLVSANIESDSKRQTLARMPSPQAAPTPSPAYHPSGPPPLGAYNPPRQGRMASEQVQSERGGGWLIWIIGAFLIGLILLTCSLLGFYALGVGWPS